MNDNDAESAPPLCPRCHAGHVVRNGSNRSSTPGLLCRGCGRRFAGLVVDPTPGRQALEWDGIDKITFWSDYVDLVHQAKAAGRLGAATREGTVRSRTMPAAEAPNAEAGLRAAARGLLDPNDAKAREALLKLLTEMHHRTKPKAAMLRNR